ncbi:MAG: hypothetical protein WA840_11405 [Caulobacteraceae bacterium]
MKRNAFASLCGISKQQVSKYAGVGLLAVDGDQVDALASLANLQGRLDETKRQKALQLLAVKQPGHLGPSGPAPAPPTGGSGVRPSAKAEKDEIERDLKRLEFGQKAGELVHVEDVRERAGQAIAAMREVFANSKRDIASDLCARFDIPAEKVTAIARFLGDKFELPLGRFATIAAALAKEPGSAPEADAETHAVADGGEQPQA